MEKREILFRGKRKDIGEWVEGYLLRYSPIFEELTYILPIPAVCVNEVEVDTETVCRCTGLTDKNCRKIFEGDVVKVEHEKYEKEDESDFMVLPEVVKYERNYVIEFVCKGTHCGYRCRNKSTHFPITPNVIYNHKIEVIGNIFDNPELVGGTEKHE